MSRGDRRRAKLVRCAQVKGLYLRDLTGGCTVTGRTRGHFHRNPEKTDLACGSSVLARGLFSSGSVAYQCESRGTGHHYAPAGKSRSACSFAQPRFGRGGGIHSALRRASVWSSTSKRSSRLSTSIMMVGKPGFSPALRRTDEIRTKLREVSPRMQIPVLPHPFVA